MTMDLPLISVIIPTHNRPELLRRALDSVEYQTYPNVEAIVVNDGGGDVSSIVSDFSKARLIDHAKTQGQSAARNTAIREAKGYYIAYLDDDDWYYPQHLEVCCSLAMAKCKRFIYTNAMIHLDDGRSKLYLDREPNQLRKENVSPTSCMFHEHNLIDDVGLFDEKLENHEDWDLWIRMSKVTDIYHIREMTVHYDRSRPSMSTNIPWMLKGNRIIQDRYAKLDDIPADILPIATPESQKHKILVYCPLSPNMPRIHARSIQSIFGMAWPNPIEIVLGRHDQVPEHQNKYDNLMEKHNRARKMALDGGYDALLFVESDIIVPTNALVNLTAIDTDVAYGLYCARTASHRWLAFSQLKHNTGRSIDRNYLYCVNHWGKVIETKGVGMGCTLIHRNVLEKIEFRRGGSAADDWYYALDCEKAGFRQHHDLGVVCGHIVDDGIKKIIWPIVENNVLYKTEKI